jgi:hypothetical protein
MQVNTSSAIDAASLGATIDNQVQVAVALKARQVQKQQGEAAVDLVQAAADISAQIAEGHIDVEL